MFESLAFAQIEKDYCKRLPAFDDKEAGSMVRFHPTSYFCMATTRGKAMIDYESFAEYMWMQDCAKYSRPERSKREDSLNDEMRCSEHDSNAVREVQ